MSLLTQSIIRQEIEKGLISFDPPIPEEQINTISVDLRLGRSFRIFNPWPDGMLADESVHYHEFTHEIEADEYRLRPHETVLGVTLEKVTLAPSIAGWLEGRSRFARMGLLIHISAGLIQPGVSNHQVLEITNLSPNDIILKAGEKICQLAFERCEGEASYSGQFQGQTKP